MPDFNHGATVPLGPTLSPDWNVSQYVNHYVNEALARRRAEKIAREDRQYLGMSQIADRCMRRVYLKVSGVQEPPMQGERLRALEMGHQFERMTYEWLTAAGFQILATNSQGQQFEFERLGGKIKGHIDGAIVSGPPIPQLRYPALWENKALKAKYWNAIAKHGLKKAEPIYYGQTQQYMDAAKVFNTLFSTANKDTSEILHVVVPLDMAEAQKLVERGDMLVNALDKGLIPPRISANADYYVCKQCELRDHCWGLPT